MTRYYSNTSSRVVIPKLGYVYPQGYEPGNIEVHAESCPPGLAQDRLHAELSLPEFSVLLPVSQGCHPGIGCRERVKGLGRFLRLAVGLPMPFLPKSKYMRV